MKCPFCLNEKISKQISVYSGILEKDVNYFKCSNCFSFYQFPYPDIDLINKYYESYFEIKKKMNPGYLEEAQLESFFNERDKTLKEIGFDSGLVINTRNVELGCANGHFLRYLIKKGADYVTGIDISKKLLSEIKITNVNLILGDLSCLEKNSVDNLFLFNILEHILEIEKTMIDICDVVKHEGHIIIEVPISGIISDLFGGRWRFFMPDEHLCIPSFKGLKEILARHNLKITGFTRFGSGLTKGMAPGFIKSIFDNFVKLLKFGDRGAFLVVKV